MIEHQGRREISQAQVDRLTASFQRATAAEQPISVCGPLALQLAEAMQQRGYATHNRNMLAHGRALHSRWTAIVEGKAPWPHVAPERANSEDWRAAEPEPGRPAVATRLRLPQEPHGGRHRGD